MLAVGGAVGGALFGIPQVLAARPQPATRNPLYIPPTVSPSGLILTERPAIVDLGGGKLSNVWAYNGLLPGPTIVASRGDSATITLQNWLSQPTITHWHGMIVDYLNDGNPRLAIPANATYNYNFTINQRAAMNWYHPHPHMMTGEQVAMGLAGAFIVRDTQEAGLGLPSGKYEVPLVVRDATFDKSGNMAYTPRNGGFEGKVPLVNGTLNPKLAVDAGHYRFRVLAGSNARIFGLALSNGVPFTLIGNDGGLLAAPVQVTQIDLAPGERVDVIVDFQGMAAGDKVMLRDLRSGWDLLEFAGTGAAGVTWTAPATLSAITPLVQDGATRDFSFDGMSRINGKVYDLNRIDFQVPLGQTELWRFTTKGNAPHPVHVHGASFQVVSRTGGRGRLFPWEQAWKDTVLLEDGETVDILIRFDAFRSLYVIHCHKLEHEDAGMMANFEVV
ncbi:MAG: multicopper oxidase domain-containing protein [Dehalococcoidia bacterium]|nr:multicopper oxidase domain-containing protein [Dehalococcoidia bacterium]